MFLLFWKRIGNKLPNSHIESKEETELLIFGISIVFIIYEFDGICIVSDVIFELEIVELFVIIRDER